MLHSHRLIGQQVIENFILAGNATFTVKNSVTGNHVTYKVAKSKKAKDTNMLFVSAFIGSDNTVDKAYAFIGTIFNHNVFRVSPKAKLEPNHVKVRGFQVIFNMIKNDNVPDNAEIWHEGRCGKCGKKLTHPESIFTGIGPICNPNKR